MLLIVAGASAGIVAAALGVGGGIVFVPVLVIALDYSQQLAQGTSLAVILPTALVGMAVHARRRRVVWHLAVPISAGGVTGAVAGAWLALQLDGLVLRRLFALLLTLLAIRMLAGTRRQASTPLDRDVNDSGG